MGAELKGDDDDARKRAEERPENRVRRDTRQAEFEEEMQDEEDLEEALDRKRHGSGDYDAEERYGRRDVFPDRGKAEPGDEDAGDAEGDDGGDEGVSDTEAGSD